MSHPYYYPIQPGGYMQPNAPNPQDAQQHQLNILLNAAKTGAVIGAAGAGAVQLHRYQQEGITWDQAARGTLKGALEVSLATTAATAVGSLFNNSALSLAATLATGTAVMYVLTRPKEAATGE